jgi:peptidoglycan/LPS O-acetylase OafA/YrhL
MGLLRLILALTVVIAHSKAAFGLRFTADIGAAEVFFMISGFYISIILDKKYTGEGSYTLFLSNRFLYLFPFVPGCFTSVNICLHYFGDSCW